MSFILDALKKLERQKEKEKPSQPGDQTVMVGGRRWGDKRAGIAFGWGSVIVAVAALVIAGLALYRSLTPSRATSNGALPPVAEISPPESPAPEPSAGTADSEDVSEPKPENPPQREPSPLARLFSLFKMTRKIIPSIRWISKTSKTSESDEVETAPPVRLTGNAKAERAAEQAKEEPESPTLEIPEGLPDLVLQGTSVVDGKPIAVVNYQRLFEGDTIEGATVIRITDRSVELEYEGKKFTHSKRDRSLFKNGTCPLISFAGNAYVELAPKPE